MFKEGGARDGQMRYTKFDAVSDGVTNTKITLLEALAAKVNPGSGYILRGYSLQGDCPPYGLMMEGGETQPP